MSYDVHGRSHEEFSALRPCPNQLPGRRFLDRMDKKWTNGEACMPSKRALALEAMLGG